MNNDYRSLPHKLLSPGATINQVRSAEEKPVIFNDRAEAVLTDFRHNRLFSISPAATVEQINDKMIACGVRMLFVTEANGILLGLVTYNDVSGEKPVRYIQEHGGTRGEILTRDIMTPLERLEALRREDVDKASVGDIVDTIEQTGRQHMLVIDTLEDGTQAITGMISSTHVERLLGTKIELSPRANTFADLERALTS
jgi:predicted transcriptional regulator